MREAYSIEKYEGLPRLSPEEIAKRWEKMLEIWELEVKRAADETDNG